MYESQSHEGNDWNKLLLSIYWLSVDHRGLDWVKTAGLFQSKLIYRAKPEPALRKN